MLRGMDTVAHEPRPDPQSGYPTIGARNITACIGNYHCICGNCNTFELARKIEPIIFPSHYHIKINIAGCPNDCNKAHLCDFGIIGVAKMVITTQSGAWAAEPASAPARRAPHGCSPSIRTRIKSTRTPAAWAAASASGLPPASAWTRRETNSTGSSWAAAPAARPPARARCSQLGHRGGGAGRAEKLAEVLRLGHGLQA